MGRGRRWQRSCGRPAPPSARAAPEITGEPPRTKPGCAAKSTYDEEMLALIEALGGLDELEDMFERGWTDGLPVVPPTPERVEAMLGGRDPRRSLGRVPPAHGRGDARAGRRLRRARGLPPGVLPGRAWPRPRPRSIPAFNAARAGGDDPAGRARSSSSTGRCGEPSALNGGMGALGPGYAREHDDRPRAPAGLTLTGGARPGGLDRATLGHPGKLGFCFAEDEEASPWEPLHVERGFAPRRSTVTLVAGDAPLSISDHRSKTPEELAATLGWAAAAQWSPIWWPMDDTSLFVLCPEHAALFAAAGWSKERLRTAMFEAVQRPAGELRRGETTPLVHASADDDARAQVDATRANPDRGRGRRGRPLLGRLRPVRRDEDADRRDEGGRDGVREPDRRARARAASRFAAAARRARRHARRAARHHEGPRRASSSTGSRRTCTARAPRRSGSRRRSSRSRRRPR